MTGTVRTFGQIAITYCSAQEMGRRLADRFESFGDRDFRKSLRIVRSVARDYNDFVKDNQTSSIQDQNNCLEARSVGNDDGGLWLPRAFSINPRFEVLSNERVLSLGFGPKSRRILEREIGHTEQFLKSAGLARYKSTLPEPHISVVKLFDPFGAVELKHVPDFPEYPGISMQPPHAYVAENRPPNA